MPVPSVWMLRAALLHLALGSLLGAWLLGAKAGALPPPPAFTFNGHGALLLLGWLAQLTLGVAYWILPRLPAEPVRGPAWIPWLTLALFNGGTLLAATGSGLSPALGPLGLALAFAGTVVLGIGMAPRIKAFGALRSPSGGTGGSRG